MRVFLFGILFFVSFVAKAGSESFQNINKEKLFDELLETVERIDGDVLPIRSERPESWKDTTKKLKTLFVNSKNDEEAFHVLERLDATYPGLHTSIEVPVQNNITANLMRSHRLPFLIYPVYENNQVSFLVSMALENSLLKKEDKILEIDGVKISDLRTQAYLYCNYALQTQCDQALLFNLHQGFFDKNFKNKKLVVVKVLRENKLRDLEVFLVKDIDLKTLYSSQFNKVSERKCPQEKNRYPELKKIFQSPQLCLYQTKDPKTGLLRVSSFSTHTDENGKWIGFRDTFSKFLKTWKTHYKTWDNLIVDVADNGGGDVPIELSKILVTVPFQDQWVRFRNFKEYKDPFLYSNLYNLSAYVNLLESHPNYKEKFYPAIAQFPVSPEKPTALYEPSEWAFPGNIRLISNRDCISSCSGFLWTVTHYGKEKVKIVGEPDSADSTYERVKVAVFQDPVQTKGYSLKVLPTSIRLTPGYNVLFFWTISASLSTDQEGNVLSMRPPKVTYPIQPKATAKEWVDLAYDQAMASF